MAVSALRRWATAASVPVFVARGGGVGLRPLELLADPRLRPVASPRHATVLLAAGRFPGQLGAALDRVHDQLGRPVRVVWWTADAQDERPAALWEANIVDRDGAIGDAVVDAHAAALAGDAGADVLADVPPNLFEGRGDHGQGGEGMMGGVPHGRPMAMTGDDRDGLALDRLGAMLGPFLVGLPSALRVHVVLQGGIVQEAHLERLDGGHGAALDDADSATAIGRRRHQLRWLVEALRVGDLRALASRVARAAAGDRPLDDRSVGTLIRRSGLATSWAGVGTIDGVDARGRLVRRLSGEPIDDVALPHVAHALVGMDWSDALVTLWSLDGHLADEREPVRA